jgi:nucleotide-binding universal stress UspA family protein
MQLEALPACPVCVAVGDGLTFGRGPWQDHNVILAGVDDRSGAEDALALGRWLAEARDEELLAAWVHPFKELPSLLDDGPDAEGVRGAIEELAGAVRSSLPPELRPELRLAAGRSPAEALERLAEKERASVIVVGPSERAGLGRILPGRTAVRLLSGSARPVAIAPEGYRNRPHAGRAVGVGFDGGPEADQALEWAADLARRLEAELRVIAVHEPIPYARAGMPFLTQTVAQVLRQDLHDAIDAAVQRLEGVTVDVVHGEGDPVAILAEQSDGLELLVLGSRAYGPVRSVLLGSVSEATVSASRAPVLVVPRGSAGRAE